MQDNRIYYSVPQTLTFAAASHAAQTLDFSVFFDKNDARYINGGNLGMLIKTVLTTGTVGSTLAITALGLMRIPPGPANAAEVVVPLTLPAATTLETALSWADGAYYLYPVSFVGDTALVSGVRLSVDPNTGDDFTVTAWLVHS